MKHFLDACYLLFLLVSSPWLIFKACKTGKYRRGILDKLLGRAPWRSGDVPCVWFHGVSVGEIHLLRTLVRAFCERHQDWECVISTTTDTGFGEARKHFPAFTVFYWPLDFSWAVARALRNVKPALVILAEGELWPNFLWTARSRGVPVAVVNGRMSPRSAARYRRLSALARPVLSSVSLFLVQNDAHADALGKLGISSERVRVTGSIKYDGVVSDRGNARTQELRRLLRWSPDDLFWVAGSTQEPEEKIIVTVFGRLRSSFPNLRLALVPRQKDRFEGVAALLSKSGLRHVRRSLITSPVEDRRAIVLFDTIGELGALWGIADVAFVGGSLDGRRGGQNMIEPAAYGSAVVFGPHTWNFRDTVKRLLDIRGAIQVQGAESLENVMRRLLGDAVLRQRLGQAARDLVQSQQGATERTLVELERLSHQAGSRDKAA
jgi:3-deoxy-D-manno-octulosonic-acid transferase